MPTLLLTGFPGFLASALLPRLLARRPEVRATCLVQQHHLAEAEERVAALTAAQPDLEDRIQLLVGDITRPGMGIGRGRTPREVVEVWHLAAVYDLAVGEEAAHRVNVLGTENVLRFCTSRRTAPRLHYVSTCYVSGSYDGAFAEDALEEGQTFRNHYESTKYEAEVLVRKAMADGLRTTIYRPGIVVGDSTTGATQKYDGPYYLASFLLRQLRVAVIPAVGDRDRVRMCVVPRDFVVAAMDELSVLDHSVGRTYALTDPNPPTVREVVDAFARHLHRRVLWVRLPKDLTHRLLGALPMTQRVVGFPAEAVDYFASPTTYDTQNTQRDLTGTGLSCPPFGSYVDRLLDYMQAHPELSASAMV